MEQLGYHFVKFDICILFRKSVDKIHVSLKSDKNNGTVHADLCTFVIISGSILRTMRNASDKVVEEIKTHILYSITLFPKILTFMRMWEKYGTARQDTDDNIIRRMRFAWWITKATDTHTEYVILIAFPRQKWLRERA